MKKVLFSICLLFMFVFLLFTCNSLKVNADTDLLLSDYENANKYSGTTWLVPYESLDTLRFYSINSAYTISGTISYGGIVNDREKLINMPFVLSNYSNEDTFYNGLNYKVSNKTLYILSSEFVPDLSANMYMLNQLIFNKDRYGYIILQFDTFTLDAGSDNFVYMWNYDLLSGYNWVKFDSYEDALLQYLLYQVNFTREDILYNPNSYNLYTKEQYNDYGELMFSNGKALGEGVAQNGSLSKLFSTVFDTPINMLFGKVNNDGVREGGLFNISLPIGNETIDLTQLFTALFTIALLITILKLFL